jgi:hypothetical protein
VISAV